MGHVKNLVIASHNDEKPEDSADCTCETCHYSDFSDKNAPSQGTCRLNPPQLILMPGMNPLTRQPEMNINSMFPMVLKSTYCFCHEYELSFEALNG